jgi:cytoskeletal protein RodZ
LGVFGEKLRKQREQRGLELDAISNTTKISTRMLRALEDEHFDQLPGGVFNKGFVRAYARQIGLNEEEAVADYLTALRESQIEQQAILPDFRSPASKPFPGAPPGLRQNVLAPPSPRANDIDDADDDAPESRTEDRRKQGRRRDDRPDENRIEQVLHEDLRTQTRDNDFSPPINSAPRPRERFPQKYPAGNPGEPADHSAPVPWAKLALTLLVMAIAVAFWNFRRHAQPAQQSVVSTQSPPASAPAQASTQTSASTNSQTVRPAAPDKNLTAEAASPSPISPPSASPSANRGSPTPLAPAASQAAPAAKLDAKPTVSTQPEVKPPTVYARTRVATVKPPPTFTLLIRAEQTTWVSLVADGKPIARETLIAPAHTSIRATHEIVVRAGNSAGISFALNGKEISAQGSEGEVRTYTFDATGLRTTQQSAAADR